jgi:hypothetical protein
VTNRAYPKPKSSNNVVGGHHFLAHVLVKIVPCWYILLLLQT